jgi:hypothetical protein
MTKYKVNWDNGASACGALEEWNGGPRLHATREDAEDAGRDWLFGMRDMHPECPEWDGTEESEHNPGYTFEVIEVEVEGEPTEEEMEEACQDETLRKAALSRGQP